LVTDLPLATLLMQKKADLMRYLTVTGHKVPNQSRKAELMEVVRGIHPESGK
jgi:hypothetical protein